MSPNKGWKEYVWFLPLCPSRPCIMSPLMILLPRKGYLQHFGTKIAKNVRCYCYDLGKSERNIFDFSLCVSLFQSFTKVCLHLMCWGQMCGVWHFIVYNTCWHFQRWHSKKKIMKTYWLCTSDKVCQFFADKLRLSIFTSKYVYVSST